MPDLTISPQPDDTERAARRATIRDALGMKSPSPTMVFASSMEIRPETYNGRTDRLTASAQYWIEEALGALLDSCDPTAAIEALNKAAETCGTLREHTDGRAA